MEKHGQGDVTMAEIEATTQRPEAEVFPSGGIIIPEKSSAWKEEEKAAPAAPEPPKVPAWVPDFPPGSIFLANGWQCVIRHTGEGEPGAWMTLIEPVERSHTRGQRRAEFRRLKRSVGKKKARELMTAKEASA